MILAKSGPGNRSSEATDQPEHMARRSEFPYLPLSASALGGARNICPNSAHLEVLDETFRIRHHLLDRIARLVDALENMLGLFDGQDSGAAKVPQRRPAHASLRSVFTPGGVSENATRSF